MSNASAEPSDRVTCAGCRQTGRARNLERFVYHESTGLVHDMRRGAPGQETFVHPHPGCLGSAVWSGWSRQLGRPLEDLERDAIIQRVQSNVRTRLVERLGEAARHRQVIIDEASLRRSAASDHGSGALELVLVASDEAHDELMSCLRSHDVPVFEILEGAELGEALGRSSLGALGLEPGERAEAIGRDVEKLVCLEFEEL